MFISHGKTKSRTVPGPTLLLQEDRRNSPTSPWVSNWTKTKAVLGGTQITESDGNRWPPPKEGPLEDHGSEFYTQKKEVVTSKFPYSVVFTNGTVQNGTAGRVYRSQGNLIANCFMVHDTSAYRGVPDEPLKLNWPPDMSSSRSSLETKGAIAVSAVAPGNQVAHAASAIGEALQNMPRIPGLALWESRLSALGTLAALGDEFLNYTFGIDPTVNDIMTFVKGVKKVDDIVDHFIRDSGRVVRRKFVFPEDVSETESVLPGVYSPVGAVKAFAGGNAASWFLPNYGFAHPGYQTIRKRTVKRETWFSGAFTYHLPGGYDAHTKTGRRLLMAKLLGAQPDLNTLWQLTPWSWAVDWFSDAGNLVKNLQSKISYGTVMRYGYVMEKTTVTDTYSAGLQDTSLDPTYGALQPPYPVVSPITLRVTTKKRVQANPFGFGLSWDGLSSTQKAIVAALGITRVVR